jgi:hypothetical protein
MKTVEKLLDAMRNSPASVSFSDAVRVAEHYFGKPRISGSHHIFKMPWRGNPRINLQEDKSGGAKSYQVRQLLVAIDQLLMTRRGRGRQ